MGDGRLRAPPPPPPRASLSTCVPAINTAWVLRALGGHPKTPVLAPQQREKSEKLSQTKGAEGDMTTKWRLGTEKGIV